ncbi:MAG: hypothetical protein FWD72_01465 [Eggerthellaceae bacterium]|nr:hypothetical protein [Eggerthellaceae bacterium]
MVGKKALSAVFVLAAALALTACLTTVAFAYSPDDTPHTNGNECYVLTSGGDDFGYNSFADALADVQTEDTIYLLISISNGGDIVPTSGFDFRLTIDLNNCDLEVGSITIGEQSILTVRGDTPLTATDISVDGGSLRIEGNTTVKAETVSVNNVGILSADANFEVDNGISADNGAQVSINGNIDSGGNGITAQGGATVMVYGNVTASGTGVFATGDNTYVRVSNIPGSTTALGSITAVDGVVTDDSARVDVFGNITASGDNGNGVWAQGGSTITVNGAISDTGDLSACVRAQGGSTVTVNGGLSAKGASGSGVAAQDDGTKVDVTGNIQAGFIGILSVGNADVTLTGNIDAFIGAATGSGATATVNGNITAGGVNSGSGAIGATASGSGKTVVNGNIAATGADALGAGAESGGTVTVNGTITAPNYVGFGYTGSSGYQTIYKPASQNDPSSLLPGYLQYSYALASGSYVWVKAVPDATDLIPGTGDGSQALLALLGFTLVASALCLAVLLRCRQLCHGVV